MRQMAWPPSERVRRGGRKGQLMPGTRNRSSGRSPQKQLQGERAEFVARLAMIARHWPSVERLARAAGVSPSAFRKWLKGEAEPSRERLVALADAAHVGIAWLARGEGPEPHLREVRNPGKDGQ